MEDHEARRPVPTAVLERRQVREAVAKIAVSVEELQREAAFLSAIAGRPGPKPDLRPVRKELEVTKTKLERAVAKLPEHLRGDSRITDLRKAIASLEAHLPQP